MSAAPNPVPISVEEYLNTSDRPDSDYVNGEIENAMWARKIMPGFKVSFITCFTTTGRNGVSWPIRSCVSRSAQHASEFAMEQS